MKYKIIYHIGSEITSRTKVESGTLLWQERSLLITGPSPLEAPFTSFVSVDLFRQKGAGRMVKLVCRDRTLFLTVVRFNIGSYFAIVNFLKAGSLFEKMKAQIQQGSGRED